MTKSFCEANNAFDRNATTLIKPIEIVLNSPDTTLCKMDLDAMFNIYSTNIQFKIFGGCSIYILGLLRWVFF